MIADKRLQERLAEEERKRVEEEKRLLVEKQKQVKAVIFNRKAIYCISEKPPR